MCPSKKEESQTDVNIPKVARPDIFTLGQSTPLPWGQTGPTPPPPPPPAYTSHNINYQASEMVYPSLYLQSQDSPPPWDSFSPPSEPISPPPYSLHQAQLYHTTL